MKIIDCVEVIVEKERYTYTHECVHKGMQGGSAMNRKQPAIGW